MKKLEELEVQDKVIFQGRLETSIKAIERVTKTQIILEGGSKFNRKTGERIGCGMYDYAHIKIANEDDIKKTMEEQYKKKLCHKLNNFIAYGSFDIETLEKLCEILGIDKE